MRKLLFIAPLLALILPLPLRAQSSDDVPLPPVPYTSSATARFLPVARDLVLPPRGSFVQVLNVIGMDWAASPVRGPRMTVVLENDRAVPVKISVGAYASS